MKHVFTFVGLAFALLFVAVFFTGRVDSKQLTAVAPRVGMDHSELTAMVPRVSSRTGATLGTSRRVVYLLACSGIPDSRTMEAHAMRAASITEAERVTARQATAKVLNGEPRAFADC